MPKKPVTQRTIADELGVSVTTVARALSGGGRISAEVAHKVRETATRLGYVSHLSGVKLRTGRTLVLTAFFCYDTNETVGDYGSVGLLSGIHRRLSTTDYSVNAILLPMRECCLAKMKQVVRGRNTDGILLDHTTPNDERVKFLLGEKLPFVTFGETNFSDSHAYFDLENENAAYQGTASLIDQGFRRIAIVDSNEKYNFVRQRMRGYRRALLDASIDAKSSFIIHIDEELECMFEAGKKIAKLGADAVVCVNELCFLNVRAGVRQILGNDAEKVGYAVRSGTNLSFYVRSHLNMSFYPMAKAGWNLADILLNRINGTPIAECQRIASTELRLNVAE